MEEKFSPNELYSSSTLYTLGGASTGVWLITSVISNIISIQDSYIKFIGLAVALFLAYIGAININKKLSLNLAIIAFFNGLLIFVTASGINSINQGIELKNKSATTENASLIPFLDKTTWWKPVEFADSLKTLNNLVESQNIKIIENNKELDSLRLEIIHLKLMAKVDKKDLDINKSTKNLSKVSNKRNDVFDKKESSPKNEIQIFELNGLYGLYKGSDTLIFPTYSFIENYKYDSISYFIVSKDNFWGILNNDGTTKVACKQKSRKFALNALEMTELLKEGDIKQIGI